MEKKDILDAVYEMYSLLSSIITLANGRIVSSERSESDVYYSIRCMAERLEQRVNEIEDSITTVDRSLNQAVKAFAEVGVSV